MISYSPKHWFLFIFKIHKAETFRELFPLMTFIGLYAFAIDYLMIQNFHPNAQSKISGLSIVYSVLGFVISLLLVFRTNTAYERWWEGRKAWGGLINCSRNLAITIKTLLPATEHPYFNTMIGHYSHALRLHLQGIKYKPADLETVGITGEVAHLPNAIALKVWERINQHPINDQRYLTLHAHWQQWTELCGVCERIKNTPIPFSYSAFLKKFLFFYIMFMPFAYVGTLGYFVVPLVVFIFYVLASIELIAEEIENPFGTDKNDLPLENLEGVIKKTVNEIFELK